MPSDTKSDLLRRHGALNPRPGDVTDPLFQASDFFDPSDLVQVKYEMLRRERKDGLSVTGAAARFGLSRVTFYQAREAFEQAGIEGLLPKKRGPKGGHKLTDEVVARLLERRREDPSATPVELARDVEERFGITVHPRSVRRALVAGKKKRP